MLGELARYADIATSDVAPVRDAPSIVDYRVRAKLAVAPGARIGLYAAGTHDVVDIPECRVLSPALRDVAGTIRRQAGDPPADARPLYAALLAVDLREALDDGKLAILVTLVLDRDCDVSSEAARAAAVAIVRDAPAVVCVATSRRAVRSAQLLGTDHELVLGVGCAPDRIGAVRHLATPGAFVQTHRAQAAALHAELLELVRGALGDLQGKRGLDLYAGSGAIGLALAHAGVSMTLVEAFPPAADAARRASAWLPSGRVAVVAGDAARVATELAKRGAPPDVVVVNPPRRGLAPGMREALGRLAPRAVAYVSCNPATLARDLDHLARLGLGASVIRPFDMIPLTDEVETLAILKPATLPPLRVLHEDTTIIVVDKVAHEAPSRLLQRVRGLPGWEAAVALGDLDATASGACVFARDGTGPAVRRIFFAGVRGHLGKGVVNRPDRGAPARTRYRRLAVVDGHTLVRVEALPGGPGQIQRHLAGIGHPVLGDARAGHPPTNRHLAERHGLDRSLLHCGRVELDHPATGRLVVDSPLAGDLVAFLARVGASPPALS